MKKVAKLIYLSLVTRVIVDESATEEEIINASKINFIKAVQNDLHENVEEILDDEEVPYDETRDK